MKVLLTRHFLKFPAHLLYKFFLNSEIFSGDSHYLTHMTSNEFIMNGILYIFVMVKGDLINHALN